MTFSLVAYLEERRATVDADITRLRQTSARARYVMWVSTVALIPLTAMSPPGLLVLGSVDRDRFHPGMSVEFLSRMAELIADSLLHP